MSLVEINKNQRTYMLHYAQGPAQHSPVAPIAARIPSSNAGERGPRANAECENSNDIPFISMIYPLW